MGGYVLEACADSVESAVIATSAGANRLELCANLMIGGTTPTLATFEQVRKRCENIINVLVRPRFGDFCYTKDEFEIIKNEVRQFREAGADGIVTGILKPDGSLDIFRMKELMVEAGDMTVTLHRAFDVCADPYKTLEEAVALGIDIILTSGQANVCTDGKKCLKEAVRLAGGRIEIEAGSGVNAEVIEELYKETGVRSFHMSGKVVIDSPMIFRKEGVHMGLDSISEYDIWRTGEENIRKAVEVIEKLKNRKMP